MPSDPSDVGHARVAIVVVDIENVFEREDGSEKVSGGRVNDTLGLPEMQA